MWKKLISFHFFKGHILDTAWRWRDVEMFLEHTVGRCRGTQNTRARVWEILLCFNGKFYILFFNVDRLKDVMKSIWDLTRVVHTNHSLKISFCRGQSLTLIWSTWQTGWWIFYWCNRLSVSFVFISCLDFRSLPFF